MSKYSYAFQRLHRNMVNLVVPSRPFIVGAYPSLNLMIQVNAPKNEVQVVLPGLRYDDIDHTGQPNMVRMFDIMSHVETAAFGNNPSFLDYIGMRQQNLRVFIKACVMEIDSLFYETTTPKAPLDSRVTLANVGKRTFTTLNELYCSGKLKPSIRTRCVYAVVNKKTGKIEELPEWWKSRFVPLQSKPNSKLIVDSEQKRDTIHSKTFMVPLNDTDHNERTRCASYLRYFTENISIASRNEALEHIKSSFHEFHIKKLEMLYYGATGWGDTLTSETWQTDNPLQINCQVSKEGIPMWFGKLELHEKVFGLPELETKRRN